MVGKPTRSAREASDERVLSHNAGRLTVVSNEAELRSMIDHLNDPGRVEPVVAVAASTESGEPVLSYAQIRSVVGDDARVYFVSQEFLLARLEGAVGPRLALREDALRVWWHALNTRSDPGDHPQVHAMDSETSEGLLEVFGSAFDLSRPRVRQAIKLNSQLGWVEARSLCDANQRAENAEAVAAEAVHERDEAVVRAQRAEARAIAVDQLPTERRLHALIWRDWVNRLDAQQRREHNLNYILSERFVQAVEAQSHLDMDRLAWLCMMLASRSGLNASGLEAQQLFAGASGRQIARADGAQCWRCKASELMPGGGSWVYYWVLPHGAIEFDDLEALGAGVVGS
jgi:hypothetical protein